MKPIKTLVIAITGISFASAASGQTYTKNQIGMALMRANTVALDHGKTKTGHNSVWAHLRSDFRMNEVNPELVRRHESKFAASAAYFNRTIERSRPYMYHISREVAKRNMPAEIALLPFIESAYVTKAKSTVGASGLWQFMPATGRHYGLEQTPLYDGRHDVYAATDAALNYLEYLHGLFGDWSLALAAYNWGEGNVGRAVNRARAQGLEPVYENLKMPAETRNYVPKLLAVRNIVNNPQYFGMNFADLDNKPFFKAVDIDQPIDLSAAVRLSGISQAEFDALNPAFKTPVYIPKIGRKLLLPASAAATFERNYKKADRATLLSWDVYTPYADTDISSIAAETGMSTAEIKRLNGLSKNNIAAGRSILVAKNNFSGKTGGTPLNFAALDTDTNPNDNKLQTVPQMGTTAAVATAQPKLMPAPRTLPESAPVFTQTAPQPTVSATPVFTASDKPAPAPAAAPVDFTRAAAPALPDDLTVKTEPAAPAAPVVETAAAQTASPVQTASAAPAPAAEDGNSDLIMNFVQTSGLQQAETAPVQTAEAEAAEHNRQAKAAAEARARQKQAAEARALAAAKAAAPGTHKVADGDTLFNIAKRYDMNVADLVAANNIKGNTIRQGQILKVAASKGRAAPAAVRPVSYTVRQGDTLAEIARRFNVDVKDVRRWNNNSTVIRPGQNIRLQGS
ncbi:LysM domain protein [Neisseria sp. oral taxon 020 str. F0370]|uniref:LysM peptidoglycan-binding domain-containing protein n=1 Tax=unclassified Neisseria TaxID=2623750 RepID=UPI0002A1C7D4|nr:MULTISPECIES: LysM peptidoglycan-binding domain-containing protein [unclassified Neisseria]ASP17154.1 lytic transglycosylase [Neisseria sp. KEM232]EKY03778.1 LysM domain protein [Neisseria sp. oral taxon 020 str. F0370]